MNREQRRAIAAAIVALEIHAESCGHGRLDPDCAYCDDRETAERANAALAEIA